MKIQYSLIDQLKRKQVMELYQDLEQASRQYKQIEQTSSFFIDFQRMKSLDKKVSR